MNINDFNVGDIIVRTKPATIPNSKGDHSYIGNKMIFQGCANGMIYCRRLNPRDFVALSNGNVDLQLLYWSEDWEYWVELGIRETTDDTILEEDVSRDPDATLINDADGRQRIEIIRPNLPNLPTLEIFKKKDGA